MDEPIHENIKHPHRFCMFVTIADATKDIHQIIHISSWIILIFFGFLTNGLFLFTILKNGSLRNKAMNRLLMVLSAIDILILINELLFIVYPFAVKTDDVLTSFQTPLVVTSLWVYTFFEHLSVGILIVIPYERFRGICFPLNIQSNSTSFRKYVGLVFAVTIAYVATFACIFYFLPGSLILIWKVLLITPIVVTVLISIILYGVIIVVLFKRNDITERGDQLAITRFNTERKSVVIVLAINTLVFCVLNALRKYFDTRLVNVFDENFSQLEEGAGSLEFVDRAWHWASYMAICTILNSTINPIIYNMGGRQYRQAMYRATGIHRCFNGQICSCNQGQRKRPSLYTIDMKTMQDSSLTGTTTSGEPCTLKTYLSYDD
ncbi:hypothetical protein BSL78_27861 [Apostichopus japonicus]|uniref:G-protein coupled receptors family 1 profile domain-containing protein n=1 Tax=Stichopus japonicus TaxID=307972 RepID=A0A2G8JHW4_STIJA|nr:hypothetical protein BSL78_27861 [Apostichopus japonicus]